MDVWFNVGQAHLHRVIDLLPNLDWEGTLVGIRVEFSPIEESKTYINFREAYLAVRADIAAISGDSEAYSPSPRDMVDYLSNNLKKEYELKYFVLDRSQFNDVFVELENYDPLPLVSDTKGDGRQVLHSLIRVDCLHAQRHLSDSAGGVRAEDLSRCLSRFYNRNLEKRENDHTTIKALTDAESMLNEHLKRVFGPTLEKLGELGYPGIANPKLVIKSTLNPATILSANEGAKVHYALGEPQEDGEFMTLPDRYNGLGFKNLIYMVVELLDIHNQWMDIEEDRPPLHLIFIEEPEAHLHAQLQQVFIRKVLDILKIDGEDQSFYKSQVVATTHSPHILYERGFRPIRYFRRGFHDTHTSEVLNLSNFYNRTDTPVRDFLERYLKLTHCDLFFADSAILVEGNVERLLLPQMISKIVPQLESVCLTILEIGGAFGHRFKSLIDFLGITTLIITDIDSVVENAEEQAEAQVDNDNEIMGRLGKACEVGEPNAVTSNQALIQWLPGIKKISELLAADEEQRTQKRTHDQALVHVTYQCPVDVSWRAETARITGRTLEEAFALQNLTWCQDPERAELGLRIRGSANCSLDELAKRIYNRVKSSSFNKTDFALALLSEDINEWEAPSYIVDGLLWLQRKILPVPVVESPEKENVAA